MTYKTVRRGEYLGWGKTLRNRRCLRLQLDDGRIFGYSQKEVFTTKAGALRGITRQVNDKIENLRWQMAHPQVDPTQIPVLQTEIDELQRQLAEVV